jgi:hypothetical protein
LFYVFSIITYIKMSKKKKHKNSIDSSTSVNNK